MPFDYSQKDILQAVNYISSEHYDAIKFVEKLPIMDAHANFTPARIMHDYAKTARRECYTDAYGTTLLNLYTGTYKYMAYSINSGKASLLLERI